MPLLDELLREFRTDESTALRPLRERALANAKRKGLPTLRDEEWKYTDVGRLPRAQLTTQAWPPSLAAGAAPFADGARYRLVFVNGRFAADLSAVDALPAGLRLRAISEVLRGDPASLASVYERYADDEAPVFTALNTAFGQDGALLELAADCVVEEPVLVAFINTGGDFKAYTAPQLLIRAGTRSRLTVVEVHHGRDGAGNLTNALTDIDAAPDSRVEHYRLADEAPLANHIGTVHAELAANCSIVSHSFAFGGALTRIEVNAVLAGPGAAVTLNGLFVAGAGQHIDHQTRIDHQAPHSTSEELYKGIADDDGHGVFRGKVLVRPGAQKISARQASHNLLLSPNSEIDTKPELEIYADDVACAHGATVGQIDDDALFYLRSRGIPAAEARALLIFGFAQEVIERVDFAPLRAWLSTTLAGRADVPLPTLVEAGP